MTESALLKTDAKFWGEVKTKVFTKRTAATTSS